MSQPLVIPLRPSRVFASALTLVAGTGLGCAWISLPLPAFLLVAPGVLLAWGWHCAQALQRGKTWQRTLVLDADGGARCEDALGRWSDAQVLPGGYVSAWLTVVMLGAGKRRRALVLPPDAALAEDLRRLRVWLRWRLVRT